jgi:hypothetical protein
MLDDTKMTIMELSAQGYTCAQIVVHMGLRLLGRENPDLIRSLGALAMGASCGDLCGALTGGLCLLSLFSGKGLVDERPLPGCKILYWSLIKWFKEEELEGKIKPTCLNIFEAQGLSLNLETAVPGASCADLVSHTFQKVLSLLQEMDIDPTEGRSLE